MNLDKAFVLLFASIGAVAGFAPSGPAAFSVATHQNVQKVRIASAIFSEVEESTEAPAVEAEAAPVEAAVEAPVEAAPAPAAFDTAIYIGNVSFGEFWIVLFKASKR